MNTINKILQIYTSKTPYSIDNIGKGSYHASKMFTEANQATQGRGHHKTQIQLNHGRTQKYMNDTAK